jgi:hypothetical protein
MGSEIVHLYVGSNKVEFTIHRQLLLGAGHIFSEMFPPERKPTERVTLGKEEPRVFKLFVEYLYTKTIPGVHRGMGLQANTQRLHDLCQLYAFSDKFQIDPIISNKIIDAIQDAFLFLEKLPDLPLVSAVYLNTPCGSKLRQFCIASLLFAMPSRGDLHPDNLSVFLAENKEALWDFIYALKSLDSLGRDPRVRDCQGESGCVECLGDNEKLKDKQGAWPCQYHIHSFSPGPRVKFEKELAATIVDGEEACYLWGA